jgi:hypothetical protein
MARLGVGRRRNDEMTNRIRRWLLWPWESWWIARAEAAAEMSAELVEALAESEEKGRRTAETLCQAQRSTEARPADHLSAGFPPASRPARVLRNSRATRRPISGGLTGNGPAFPYPRPAPEPRPSSWPQWGARIPPAPPHGSVPPGGWRESDEPWLAWPRPAGQAWGALREITARVLRRKVER